MNGTSCSVKPPCERSGSFSASGVVSGNDPGLTDLFSVDLRPAAGSPVLDLAGPLDAGTSLHPVDRIYVHPRQGADRLPNGPVDLGALER